MANKFKYFPFSNKQKKILTWWIPEKSPVANRDAIITDGAIRSGKTIIMSLSFVIWAMTTFNGQMLGMAGKTISSFKRNVWITLNILLRLRGYRISKVPEMKDAYRIRKGKVSNDFYFFGGKDEASQYLVQGFTAAGFFFDEVALMPESFVNQAVARCSVEGAKLWFNCNPEGPFHWFKVEWIDKLIEKNAYRIQFRLDDNPSLSEARKNFYKRMFSGVFYQRYILGLWVVAEGIIYSMFKPKMIIDKVPKGVKIKKKWIGVDYGQSNATVYLLCGLGSDNKLYILDEYYHSGKESPIQKSPSAYAKEFYKWLKKNGVKDENGIKYPVRYEYVFIDPSAKGFILQLHEDGKANTRLADNEVIRGIELVSSIIENDMLRILSHCKNTIMEINTYAWDSKAQEKGLDKPLQSNDHAMDALRYVVNGTRKIWQHLVRVQEEEAA